MRPLRERRKTLPRGPSRSETLGQAVKNFLGFGRSSRPDDDPPRGDPKAAAARDPGSEDSFLTGDERVDATNLDLLLRTIAEVNSTIDIDRLLVSIVDKAIAVTRGERGFLLLREGSGATEPGIRVARDARGSDLPRDTRFSKSVATQVVSTRAPVRSMVNSDAEALELGRSVFDLKIRAVMCVPLKVRDGGTLGAVYVDSRVASREFTRADLAFFAAFADQATIALENARLVRDSLEKERMAQELRIANEIQRRTLPSKAPSVSGFDLHGYYQAATEGTGDSYDFVPLKDGRWGVVVGDVSGHGIGPALVTMSSRARLHAYLKLGLALGDAVTRLNVDMMAEVEDGMFQTLFVGIVDPKTGQLAFVNAGHPPPLLLRSADESFELLGRTGVAVGFVEGETYTPREDVELRPGDVLLAYTDGIVEARRGREELYGETRLRNVLLAHRGESAKEILQAVVASVKEFAADRVEDDLTLIVVKRLP